MTEARRREQADFVRRAMEELVGAGLRIWSASTPGNHRLRHESDDDSVQLETARVRHAR